MVTPDGDEITSGRPAGGARPAARRPYRPVPSSRRVTSPVVTRVHRRGVATVVFFLGGEDRTGLIEVALATAHACCPTAVVADLRAWLLDGHTEAGIHILFRHPGRDPGEAARAMVALTDGLQALDGRPIAGRQFVPRRVVRTAVAATAGPGAVALQTATVAAAGLTVWDMWVETFAETTVVHYTLAADEGGDEPVERWRAALTGCGPGVRIGIEAEGDALRADVLRAAHSLPLPDANGLVGDPNGEALRQMYPRRRRDT